MWINNTRLNRNRYTSDAVFVETFHLTGVWRSPLLLPFDDDFEQRRARHNNNKANINMAGIDHALEGIPRCALCCSIFRHARCDVSTRAQTTFVLSMIIPFDNDDSDAVVRQDAQNSPPTFCCYSSAHYFTQRIWDIQNRRHIRAPQREEVTDDGTDYEVHFVKASDMPFEMSMRCDVFLSLSLSLSRAFFFCTPRAPPPPPPSRSVVVVSFLFVALFFFLSLSLSLPPWSNRTRVPLLTECSRM